MDGSPEIAADSPQSGGIAASVRESLDAMGVADTDVAAAALARAYAQAIERHDDVLTLSDLGPKLLATLEALGGTPRARAGTAGKLPKGVNPNAPVHPGDVLRQRRVERLARFNGPASVDTATS